MRNKNQKNIKKFPKVRADDFIQEICHIDKILKNNIEDSPLELHNSIETMLVISAAHKSAKEKKTVYINYKNDTKFTTWLKNVTEIFKDLFILDLANNHQGDLKHGIDIINSYSKVAKKKKLKQQ